MKKEKEILVVFRHKQIRVLRCLVEHEEGISAFGVAKETKVAYSLVSAVLDGMVKRGLATWQHRSKGSRGSMVYPTEKAHQLSNGIDYLITMLKKVPPY